MITMVQIIHYFYFAIIGINVKNYAVQAACKNPCPKGLHYFSETNRCIFIGKESFTPQTFAHGTDYCVEKRWTLVNITSESKSTFVKELILDKEKRKQSVWNPFKWSNRGGYFNIHTDKLLRRNYFRGTNKMSVVSNPGIPCIEWTPENGEFHATECDKNFSSICEAFPPPPRKPDVKYSGVVKDRMLVEPGKLFDVKCINDFKHDSKPIFVIRRETTIEYVNMSASNIKHETKHGAGTKTAGCLDVFYLRLRADKTTLHNVSFGCSTRQTPSVRPCSSRDKLCGFSEPIFVGHLETDILELLLPLILPIIVALLILVIIFIVCSCRKDQAKGKPEGAATSGTAFGNLRVRHSIMVNLRDEGDTEDGNVVSFMPQRRSLTVSGGVSAASGAHTVKTGSGKSKSAITTSTM